MNRLVLDSDSLMPLRDVVYKTLRDAILKGELKPKTRLMEIHLADEMGVSRTPVREAIRLLEKEGLVITYPRRGAVVAHMTVKDMEDVLEIRETLDIFAVKKACDNANSDTISLLEERMEAFKEAVKGNDSKTIVEADEAFHRVIYECADNPKLIVIINGLKEQMYRYRFEYIKESTMLKNLMEEHELILNGIKSRDKEFVARIMKAHLDNQYSTVKRLIESGRDN